jgi:murein DD-endopeptidase MepM/ murein hydrolase activator NlpD
VRQPPQITPKLTAGGYVFPVYGPSSFTDTFGAARSDVSGGWHHGGDIFAPLGAPILSVASGTVFSVGWNKVGGNRLWLRDGQGNLFYYAHLSAFTPLAVNGNKVNAGDVLGFVGSTGDAQGTPTHLHFEIHPVGLIGLGYDGAVNPTTYLLAWKHLQDVSFAGGDAWAPLHSLGNAPKPGAILLTASDISSADGLVPGSLERAIRPLIVRGDNFSSKSKLP